MARSRFNNAISKLPTLESAKAKIEYVRQWIYQKCKSNKVRYFVSAIAGGGAALVIVGMGAAIGLSGPATAVFAVAAFVAAGVLENQRLVAGKKSDTPAEKVRLLDDIDEEDPNLNAAEKLKHIEELYKQLSQQQKKDQETTFKIISMLALQSDEEIQAECRALLQDARVIKPASLDSIFQTPDQLAALVNKAPLLNVRDKRTQPRPLTEDDAQIEEILLSVAPDEQPTFTLSKSNEKNPQQLLLKPRTLEESVSQMKTFFAAEAPVATLAKPAVSTPTSEAASVANLQSILNGDDDEVEIPLTRTPPQSASPVTKADNDSTGNPLDSQSLDIASIDSRAHYSTPRQSSRKLENQSTVASPTKSDDHDLAASFSALKLS